MNWCDRHSYKLFLLGDVFDHWMEYPGRTPDFGHGFRSAIRRYSERHGPVLHITGNHDNWTLGGLAHEGFDQISESARFDIHGRSVFLLHGDGLADPSLLFPRPLYHRVLRHPLFVRMYRFLLPMPLALDIMKGFSRWQRRRHPEHNDTETLDRWVLSALDRGLSEVIIAGHHHQVRHMKIGNREYLNTGAFFRTRTIVTHTDEGFRVVVWDSRNQSLNAATE